MPKIAVILGSDSDLPVLEKGTKVLDTFSLEYELRILSAHRTPAAVTEYVSELEGRGFAAVIAGAGKAAHLPGVVAAHTVLPVIGLPIRASLDGLDALLSIVQMPGGIPVATVGINASDNAVLLAIAILALQDEDIRQKLHDFRKDMTETVLEKDRKVREG
jgi:5-(carboxyamino)imidazole ribonucleotide mutase